MTLTITGLRHRRTVTLATCAGVAAGLLVSTVALAPAPSDAAERPAALVADVELTADGRGLVIVDRAGRIESVGTAASFDDDLDIAPAVVDLEVTADGQGAWLLRLDGSVEAVGEAPELSGSTGLDGRSQVVDLEVVDDGAAHWIATTDRIRGFGSAAGLDSPVFASQVVVDLEAAPGGGVLALGSTNGIAGFSGASDASYEGGGGRDLEVGAAGEMWVLNDGGEIVAVGTSADLDIPPGLALPPAGFEVTGDLAVVAHDIDGRIAADPATGFSRPADTVPGYTVLTANGRVIGLGAGSDLGSTQFDPGSGDVVSDLATVPGRSGYWTIDTTGRIRAFGDARPLGVTPPPTVGERYVAIVATSTGAGAWAITDTGRVVPRGDAPEVGDVADLSLNAPITDAFAVSEDGLLLVGVDGGVFALGTAPFLGSMGGRVMNAPVVAGVPAPDGAGYWLVGMDGGVFSFGSASFLGSMGATPLFWPVSDASPYGDGYVLVGVDGGVFNFGDQPFLGSAFGGDVIGAIAIDARPPA